MPEWVTWLIVAVIAVAIVAAIAMAAARRKKEANRVRASELRERAAVQTTEVQKREAHARETEAEAAAARAEADRKQAEAQRLAAEAEDRRRSAETQREEHERHLREADELDPDVNTRSEDYTGPSLHSGTRSVSSTRTPDTGDGHDAGMPVSRDDSHVNRDGAGGFDRDGDDRGHDTREVVDDDPTRTEHRTETFEQSTDDRGDTSRRGGGSHAV
jgi:flagellar biosynthesis GTPase FlhF